MTREKVQITREFPYPISTVFQAFADQSVAQKWLAPDNFTCPVVVQEVWLGGRAHTHFVDENGNDAISEGVYTKVAPNSVLESKFDVSYLDCVVQGLTSLITFESTETGTRVTIELSVPDSDFATGCTIGWNESLDNLERYFGAKNV